ncbi:hypothetical protein FNYG_06780 [Fusarium nygamai]|uniref:Protein kinase domain-containing protein n=1 Tax=Gibberella nygamai TaxID=42673 RepID=A0A2K0WCR2_GIBNY|nr:hypothetical protein FNYG_06780 [Fusarium nygamai]
MAEPRLGLSEVVSEERTEPFSQSEIDARFKGIGVEEPVPTTSSSLVSLDELHVEDHHHRQGIRILFRPLANFPKSRSVSPGSESLQWLALRAEVASPEQPEHKVLAVTQTSKDIKFTVRIPGETQDDYPRPPLWCELYYDPASDKVIFLNRSDLPISLSGVSPTPPSSPCSPSHVVNPGSAKALRPGTWRITLRDMEVLDFRVLEKRPVILYQPQQPSIVEDVPSESSTPTVNSSGKRALSPEYDEKRVKRRVSDPNTPGDDGVVMFLRPSADPLVFSLPNGRESKELSSVNGHPLLDAEKGETAAISGVCEVDEYELTKREPIASTSLSAVYTATHSHVPNNIVTVKVLKTRVANPNDKALVHERTVIRQADMWLRECRGQEDLQHKSIVRYYGGDARFLSLYMEHIDAKDLTSMPRWRNNANDEFIGDRNDAARILGDIAGALNYIHGRKLVHNDIKPANILYSPERGAVLCDFGLSTPATATNSPTVGGTPYYVPPEFIGRKQRGPASDVWALGVTMLYVLRKITYPDSRAHRRHPRPLYWLIAGVNSPNMPHKQYGNGQPAMKQMRDWLAEIFDARKSLNPKDRLERIVMEMLYPNPNQRITMAKVVQELSVEQAAAPTG